ncbi:hypothetical protein N9R79_07430 [Vibrio sp.]|nr:hypothetical protein [Vibrio sp.]
MNTTTVRLSLFLIGYILSITTVAFAGNLDNTTIINVSLGLLCLFLHYKETDHAASLVMAILLIFRILIGGVLYHVLSQYQPEALMIHLTVSAWVCYVTYHCIKEDRKDTNTIHIVRDHTHSAHQTASQKNKFLSKLYR